jgi:hypothetical protein
MPQALFALVYFSGGVSCFFPRAGLEHHPLALVFHTAGITAVKHYAQPF